MVDVEDESLNLDFWFYQIPPGGHRWKCHGNHDLNEVGPLTLSASLALSVHPSILLSLGEWAAET